MSQKGNNIMSHAGGFDKRNMCKGAIAVLNDPVYKTRDIRTMLREIPQ